MTASLASAALLIPTRNRPHSLRRTLQSIVQCRQPNVDFEVVVVDNGDDPTTRKICESAAKSMNIRCVAESRPGVSHARNRGIEVTDSDLVIFTDDDVITERDWLTSLIQGARNWPDHEIFGGRILPCWPKPPPRYLREIRLYHVCFAALDPGLPAGPDESFHPYGPSMAFRRSVFERGLRFDPQLGPRPGGYIMGSESDLIERVVEEGPQAVFVPEAVVHHRIREEQMRVKWLLKRAIRFGRAMEHRDLRRGILPSDDQRLFGVPRWHFRGVLEHAGSTVTRILSGDLVGAVDSAMDSFMELGRIDYHRVGRQMQD